MIAAGDPSVPPLAPDADEARRWVLDELSRSEYVRAQPSWFDRFAKWLGDVLASLRPDGAGGLPGLGWLVLLLVVAAAIVVALLVFGVPRLRRRSALRGALFGERDERSADDIRRSAADAAAAGDHALAVAEAFRAIARALTERTLVAVLPGTTAHGFADRAGRVFPAEAGELAAAAAAFDGVRYLGRRGDAATYESIRALDVRLQRASPRLDSPEDVLA
ncbi:DUF4129 domain-containing protein [Galbitalea sp. SE-J8]|uniref:DUF4129 domain-containing protein n=1 Tax=Galbitalea sp. SE-J8 TaxID=3054952 RepID=UPI00259D2992|nr:DUF4129 domain-containing protein [Galbitalea sp. SE-J8]MDM4762707.1 DUF4129 domain-containing protein [Galbitalea sp. SE-J8]